MAAADQDYAQPPQPSALTPPPPETEERATPQPATNPAVRSWQKKWFNSIRDQLINDYPTASNSCSVSSGPLCRICHQTGVREALLSPCHCRGSLSFVHRSCIELWLGAAGTDKCDICGFRYSTVRKARGFREWIRSPGERSKVREMFGDVCYFFLVTPMVAVSVWMFICGAVHYYNSPTSGPDDWKTILPLSMSVVALVAYVTYFVIFLWDIYNHKRVFVQWQRVHSIVTLLVPPPLHDESVVVQVDDPPRPG